MKTSLIAFRRLWLALTLILTLAIAAQSGAVAQTTEGLDGPAYGTEAYADEREALFAALLAADTEQKGRAAEDAIWRMWFRGPSVEIGARMDDGSQRLRWGEYEAAEEIFSEVVAAAPDYSEAYNQRAFALFLQGDLEASLEDIDRALALEPKHFGALAGRVQIFVQQGREALALEAVREAVAIHPWLRERTLLREEEKEAPAPGEGSGDGSGDDSGVDL